MVVVVRRRMIFAHDEAIGYRVLQCFDKREEGAAVLHSTRIGFRQGFCLDNLAHKDKNVSEKNKRERGARLLFFLLSGPFVPTRSCCFVVDSRFFGCFPLVGTPDVAMVVYVEILRSCTWRRLSCIASHKTCHGKQRDRRRCKCTEAYSIDRCTYF